MAHGLYIEASCPAVAGDETAKLGPYPFVQLTYNELRVGPDGETVAHLDGEDNWVTNDGVVYSDLVIYAE